MRINLIYLSPNTTGGWVTFTAHLAYSLLDRGYDVSLYKIGNRNEPFKRPFGYGLWYHNRKLDFFKTDTSGPTIVTAVAKKFTSAYQVLVGECEARVVIHDPTETAYLCGIAKPWVIRKTGLTKFEDATFIRHPYVRMSHLAPPTKRTGCVSTSRIDFDKHTEILLDAKRLGALVSIYGFENRLYTKFKIVPNYPEWEQSKVAYPRTRNAAFDLLCRSRAMADMSLIKGDGGGTQYTTLEAWDAGSVPIVHRDWIRKNDVMVPGYNCLTAHDGASLKKAINELRDTKLREELQVNGYKELEKHAPKKTVPKILEWLRS